jgi:hypothetical protein
MQIFNDESINSNTIRRTILHDVSYNELVWHRDTKTRNITPIKCEGWMFQRDNELPFELKVGVTFSIESEVYHRLIKGDCDLILQINEY